jgi:hypothetical protein
MSRSQRESESQTETVTSKLALAELIATVLRRAFSGPGVFDVQLDEARAERCLRCDSAQVGFDSQCQTLAELGQDLAAGRWRRLKHALYAFFDQNGQAIARHQPSCCSIASSAIGRRW